ncbi:MAG: sigma-70 family RNA polymerase sigma factor [Planctomycetota bacterium]|nr:sigma-70 family RNA polymerase sigma factor [Planctomycetota bacterium]
MPGSASMTDPFSLDDSAFLRALEAGDPDAAERLVREAGGRMLAVALRLLGNEQDAHEAVQDAFLSIFRSLHSFQRGSKLTTWMHRIVVNAALMKRRSKARRPERSIEDLLPAFREDGHRSDVGPGWKPIGPDELEREETRGLVRRLIDELPDDYRTVLILRDIEELDTAATAEALQISQPAVKTRLHRARQALRTLLEREMFNP